jgi:hypothetical protein
MRDVVLKKIEIVDASGKVLASQEADASVSSIEAGEWAIRLGHRDVTIRETSWEGPRDVARVKTTAKGGPYVEPIV